MDTSPDQPSPTDPTNTTEERDASSKEIRRRVRKRGRRIPRAVQTNYLLHILFYDARFRWALIAAGLVFLAVGLLLPKIWITSPEDYFPTIKVRGLDLLQAWSLRRTAVRDEAEGHPKEALQAWVAAVANNPADPASQRGLLHSLASQSPVDRAWLFSGQQASSSLLRLTHTNLADLELAVRFHSHYDQHEWIASHLTDTNAPATPTLTAALLRALFLGGQMQKFGLVWQQRGAAVAEVPEAALYHAAWQSAWGPAGEATTGKNRLEAALAEPALRPLALSLLLRVHYKTMELAAYERRLAELADLHGDTMRDNINHWLLLDLSGQRARAITLAQSETALPQTPAEAELLLAAWMRLGLYDEGTDFARKQLPVFSQSPAVWVRLGQLLIAGKRWDDLRSTALELRQNLRLGPQLGNYAMFLEGVANHGLGRRPQAEEAFTEFAQELPKDPVITFQAAVTLGRLGYPQPAAVVLHQLEAVAGNDLTFWRQLQLTAYEARQAEQLLAASEKVYQLQPDDSSATNFAAALMMLRERASEAAQLTLQVYQHAPQSRLARVNHALALVQNGRLEEGEQLLKTVSPEDLSDSARSVLQFVWFQCHRQAGRTTAARAAADLIDVRHLFPPQVQWLEQARAELPAL